MNFSRARERRLDFPAARGDGIFRPHLRCNSMVHVVESKVPQAIPGRPFPRRLARWLFVNGGMSVVVLAGLMATGLIVAILRAI